MSELAELSRQNAVIKVIGVGGGGGNAVQHMMKYPIEGVEYIYANTDSQALRNAKVNTILQLGSNITNGLGAGSNPIVGCEAALEDRDQIKEVIEGTDLLFITAGMGGGTGTGAAPVVADIAKTLEILTVAVVTTPFPFEGGRRWQIALQGIEELSNHVDSLILIPNEKLLPVVGKEIHLLEAFNTANDVLFRAVQGVAELVTRPGLINVDFADVRTVMSETGRAMMGCGVAKGHDRAKAAAKAAISCPLLDEVDIAGASGILVNITSDTDVTIGEFNEVGDCIKSLASEEATVLVGTVIDPDITDQTLCVTLVATGLGSVAAQSEGRKITNRQSAAEAMPYTAKKKDKAGPLCGDYDLEEFDIPSFLRKCK